MKKFTPRLLAGRGVRSERYVVGKGRGRFLLSAIGPGDANKVNVGSVLLEVAPLLRLVRAFGSGSDQG